MPQTLEPLPDTFERHPHRWRWSRRAFALMHKEGMLSEGRAELIDGTVIWTSQWGKAQERAVAAVAGVLANQFGPDRILTKSRVDLSAFGRNYDEPEPDVALLARPFQAVQEDLPRAGDLLLVVQVGDISVPCARAIKAPLFALVGVSDYWVLDLSERHLIVHRHPDAGGYNEITAYGEEESVATLARPEALIRVGDLLP